MTCIFRSVGSLLFLVLVFTPLFSLAGFEDVSFVNEEQTMRILQPANWNTSEKRITTLNGSSYSYILLWDQSETLNKKTRYAYAIYATSTAAAFALPASITARLTPRELVNFYIYGGIRNSIGGKVIQTSVGERDGNKSYKIEWSRIGRIGKEKYQFVNIDEFIFKGSTVVHVHGEYIAENPTLRIPIARIMESLKIIK